MIFPTLPELLHVAERTLGPDYAVRDYGLLEAALTRPKATAFQTRSRAVDEDHDRPAELRPRRGYRAPLRLAALRLAIRLGRFERV